VIAGLAIGGVLMAPVAALLVSKLPRKPLGIAISLAIITINGYRLVTA
jgi:predicted MFS family arabinose efflux permease